MLNNAMLNYKNLTPCASSPGALPCGWAASEPQVCLGEVSSGYVKRLTKLKARLPTEGGFMEILKEVKWAKTERKLNAS
jgi:hypothetical protein